MRKRFVTTLFICMLSLACIFSFTACGSSNPDTPDGEIPKGEKVTEEQWKAAIEATLKAENYTVEYDNEESETEKRIEDGKSAITTETNSGTFYVDSEKYYSKVTYTEKETIDKGFYEDDYDYELEETSSRTLESYSVVEENIVWLCYHSQLISEEIDEETEWDSPYRHKYDNASEAKQSFSFSVKGLLNFKYILEEKLDLSNEYEGFLSELYSAFKYSEGKYSYTISDDDHEDTLTISINDGYVVGLSMVSVYEEEWSGYIETETTSYTWKIKNYGKTTVPVPEGATEVINEEKAKLN